MQSTIQRNAIVPPFSIKTPWTANQRGVNQKISSKEGQNQSQNAPSNSSEVSFAHVKFLQAVATGVNAAPQITATIPVNSGAAGEPGTVAFDSNWLYVCVGKNIWRRAALNAF